MLMKKWYQSPWAISMGTAVFSLILTIIYDYAKSKPVLSTILIILNSILGFILFILNFEVRVLWLLITFAIIILILFVYVKYTEETSEPDFLKYRDDILKKWKWSWNWKWSSQKRAWIISDLTAHCPECKTPLIFTSNVMTTRFDCPRCDFSSKYYIEDPHKIERVILDNINREKK